jgi:hypothetical protein
LFSTLRDPARPEQIGVFVVIWVSLSAAALLGTAAAARSGGGGAPAGVYGGVRAAGLPVTRLAESA